MINQLEDVIKEYVVNTLNYRVKCLGEGKRRQERKRELPSGVACLSSEILIFPVTRDASFDLS